MKYNKQLAALLLSLCLTLSMAVPSFAEPSLREQMEGSTTQETVDSDTNGEESANDGENTDSDTDTSEGNTSDENTSNEDADTDSSEDDSENHSEDDSNANEKQPDVQPVEEPELPVTTMPKLTVDAKASLLVNGETGEIIHSNRIHEKMYPASTTKILTALLTLENCKLTDNVTMEESDFVDVKNGASNAGLKEGELVTVETLLYCLLLPSGNEAANALARTVGGSVDNFAQMMNERAKELGCTDSHFLNPNGLHNDDHYTSAYDLYLIAKQAMQNEDFRTIVNTAQKKLPETNKNPERKIYTTNQLILSSYSPIYYGECYGIKTGHTTPAGYCLVSYAEKNGYTYYSVVLGAEMGETYANSFTETRNLFQWAFDSFRLRTATKAGDAVTECPVRLGRGTDHVTLVTAEDVNVLIPTNAELTSLETSIQVEKSYDAPIEQGQKLGTVTYSFDGMECASADLIALTSIERSPVLYVLDQISCFLRLTAVRIALGAIAVFVVLYLILSFIAGRNRRKRLAKRRKRRQKKNK